MPGARSASGDPHLPPGSCYWRRTAMGNPIVHWEISGKDGAALQAFYGELFDWKLNTESMPGYCLTTTGEGGCDGGIFQAPEGTPPMVTIYAMVDDLNTYLA